MMIFWKEEEAKGVVASAISTPLLASATSTSLVASATSTPLVASAFNITFALRSSTESSAKAFDCCNAIEAERFRYG